MKYGVVVDRRNERDVFDYRIFFILTQLRTGRRMHDARELGMEVVIKRPQIGMTII